MSTLATLGSEQRAMSLQDFRLFQAARPDEERWELVDGVPVMMTPPFIAHKRIATNLQTLLNTSLSARGSRRIALQRIGVDLGLDAELLNTLGAAARYAPEPDVAVIDDTPDPQRRFADRVYVCAEIVSTTDDDRELASGLRWIDAKSRLYQAHVHCEAVVVVEQGQRQVRLSRRTAAGWTEHVLSDKDELVSIPTCGLACRIGDFYVGTHLEQK